MSFFKAISGQEGAVAFLTGAVDSGRIANAYLFHGPSGVGKKLAALSFAKAVNCLRTEGGPDAKFLNGEAQDGCCDCSSCKKISSLNHPDVRLPVSDGDGASVKIDDVRAVIEDIGLKPYEANKKVYIIDGADNLTEEAANALLKTLEEPSFGSVLILISENPRRLLPTIRSRCQAVRFFPLNVNTVKEILVARHGVSQDRAHILACISCGSPGDALRLNEDDFFTRREQVIRALSSGTVSELDFDKTPRRELRSILNIMLAWYRDILVVKAGNANVINIDKKAIISTEARKADFQELSNALTRIITTQGYLDLNANPRLAMAALDFSI